MEKKITVIIKKIAKLTLVGLLLIWGCKAYNRTPSKYKNRSTPSAEIYESNKNTLHDSINNYITNKYSYFSTSDLTKDFVIDSIFYSPEKDKILFWVITKITLKSDTTNAIYFGNDIEV